MSPETWQAESWVHAAWLAIRFDEDAKPGLLVDDNRSRFAVFAGEMLRQERIVRNKAVFKIARVRKDDGHRLPLEASQRLPLFDVGRI